MLSQIVSRWVLVACGLQVEQDVSHEVSVLPADWTPGSLQPLLQVPLEPLACSTAVGGWQLRWWSWQQPWLVSELQVLSAAIATTM